MPEEKLRHIRNSENGEKTEDRAHSVFLNPVLFCAILSTKALPDKPSGSGYFLLIQGLRRRENGSGNAVPAFRGKPF